MISPSFSPGNLLTILYQLTKSQVTSCKSFQNIFIKSFRCQNLQRAITRKNIYIFFNFHQVIVDSLSSISWPSLKLLAIIVLGYLDYKISLWTFKRGITPQWEIIQSLKKNMCQLFFYEESIYEISKPYLNFWMDAWTDGLMEGSTNEPKAICPFNFSKVGGIKTQCVLVRALQLSGWKRFDFFFIDIGTNSQFVHSKFTCCSLRSNIVTLYNATVKPVLNDHSQKDRKLVFKTNYR